MDLPKWEHCHLWLDPRTHDDDWCIYEHQIVTEPGAPPEIVYINACKLIDVYRMREARNNSEWCRLTLDPGVTVMISIVAVHNDRVTAVNAAMARIKACNPIPRCNLRGTTLFAARRPIDCSNGRQYASQLDAARDLGISQSAISNHLKGGTNNVKGFRFQYANGASDAP